MESIEKIRPEVIHDFIRHLKLQVSSPSPINDMPNWKRVLQTSLGASSWMG